MLKLKHHSNNLKVRIKIITKSKMSLQKHSPFDVLLRMMACYVFKINFRRVDVLVLKAFIK